MKEKEQYFIFSVGSGYKEITMKTNESAFLKSKKALYERLNNSVNADTWKKTNDNAMYYETNTYFEFKDEKGYMLYILTYRKAKKGFMFMY